MAISMAQPPAFLKLLGHDVRWRLLKALANGDHRVQELVTLLGRPQNLVSYHLSRLRQAGLVHERRSSHDARDIYYSLDLERLQALYGASGEALHPALCRSPSAVHGDNKGGASPLRVLFLCTHNSARSQMAEGILRHLGGDRVQAFSAGSEPGRVHPLAVRALAQMNIDISGQRAKHMASFAGQTFDYIITVCDRVREACPVFPHDPHEIHWSFADPAAVEGPEEARFRAFQITARELRTRINYLLLTMKQKG
ncbi:MAG: metalloregulator ArsR/SmtB family transcription factor [Chloroflexota bacterium]